MKILITHVYSQHNKGDFAILSAMLTQLKTAFPDSYLDILAVEKIKPNQRINGISCYNSFFYFCIYQDKNPLSRIINTIHILTATTLWALIYRYSHLDFPILPNKIKKICLKYLNSDLILPVGGGYLNGKNDLQSHITLIIHLHSILIAKILNKPEILFSQTIGPFSNKFQEVIAKLILTKADAIFAREKYTITTLSQIGINPKIVYRTVDEGFLFNSNEKSNMYKYLNRLTINKDKVLVGITVRHWFKDAKQEKFESELAKFTKYLVNDQQANVVFIPQVTSKQHNDDDSVVNKRILKKIGNNKSAFAVKSSLTSEQTKGLYENLDMLVGTRMHSVVFALTGNVPCIAIEYEYKTSGIMKDLGLEKYVIKIEDVTFKKLKSLFNDVKSDEEQYKNILKKSIRNYRQKARKSSTLVRIIYQKYYDDLYQRNLIESNITTL